MDGPIIEVLIVMLGIGLGTLLIAFPRVVSRAMIRHNNRFLKLNYGEREEKIGAFILFLIGIFWVIMGVLRLLGVG